jgi:hypothetical protein
MQELPPAIWAAITATVGTVIGVLSGRTVRRADAAAALTTSALAIVNELQEEIARLRARLEHLEKVERDYEARVNKLLARIEAAEANTNKPKPPARPR